jgi:hypothetical protein
MPISIGDKYVGEYKNGKRHGQGTYTYPIGDKYVGEWKKGLFEGQGTYTFANGTTDTGIWKNDKLIKSVASSSTKKVTNKKKKKKKLNGDFLINLGNAIGSGKGALSVLGNSNNTNRSSSTTTCFLDDSWTKGFNQICMYDCLGSPHAVTVGSTDLCKLTVKR